MALHLLVTKKFPKSTVIISIQNKNKIIIKKKVWTQE